MRVRGAVRGQVARAADLIVIGCYGPLHNMLRVLHL